MSINSKLRAIKFNTRLIYDKGYDTGFLDGSNSVSPDYLHAVTTFKLPNWNLLGRKEVVLNIPLVTNYNGFMQQSGTAMNTTVEHLTINGAMNGTITSVGMAFYCGMAETTLKRLTLNCDLSKATNFESMCNYMQALEVVDGVPIDFSSATYIGSIFGGYNHGIKEFRVKPLTIKIGLSFKDDRYLSDETIQSIIDGLADITGQATRTLTLYSAVGNKLTDTQKATITAKNWTLAY